MSWIICLLELLWIVYVNMYFWLCDFFKEWLLMVYVFYYWVGKYWFKFNNNFGDMSGNLIWFSIVFDDIIYLVYSGKIIVKGKVECFDEIGVYFLDGIREEVDMVVVNIGFKFGVVLIEFFDNW